VKGHVRAGLALTIAQSLMGAGGLEAQTPLQPRADTRLFTQRDAVAAVLATGATLGVMIFDRRIAESVSDSSGSFQQSSFLRDRSSEFNHISEQPLFLAGVALYGVGRLAHAPTLADISLHAAEAVFIATISAQVVRIPLGRARPVVSDGTDPFIFHPFKGVSSRDYRAFPSVHTASTYAAAAVISGETARRWPGASWIVTPLAYGLAILPGLSRMYLNEHWASDVVMGTFFGVFAGQKVVHYNHSTNPANRVDRFFLGRAAGADGREDRLTFGIQHRF
jgi:membrane-associated phospholipid phosphatase